MPAGPDEPVPKDSLLPYMPAFGRWLTSQWRGGNWAPDVVHAHFWMSGLAGLDAARATGVPIVQTFHALGTVKRRHQGKQDTSPRGRLRCERALGRSVDQVIAQCRDEVEELRRMGVPRSRITIAPSGVDCSVFTPAGPAVPRTPGVQRLLAVGRLVERKGLRDAIDALHEVPDAELIIVGGSPVANLDADPGAARLHEHIARSGLTGRVQLVGAVPRSEMPRWYRSADLLVTAPWYEPFGLTALEAMACGVPVVATSVGGLTDTVAAGVTGDLVPARDPGALGVAVRKLLDDEPRRAEYAAAAVERVRQHYPWHGTAARLEAIYAGLATAVREEAVA